MRSNYARRIAIAAAGVLAASAIGTLPAAASTTAPAIHYSFRTLDNSSDPTFNELLGINKHGAIAGYFGSGAQGHPNGGYVLKVPYPQGNYIPEDFPGAAQTQVTAINDGGVTVGFYSLTNKINPSSNARFGFYKLNGRYHKVAFPGTTSSPKINELLGVNDADIAVGFYVDASGNDHSYLYNLKTHKFTTLPVTASAVSVTVTGINNNGGVCGFFNAATGPVKSFLRSHAGALTVLTVKGEMTQAFGVNDHDEVVGANTVGGSTFGFTWTPAGGFKTVNDPLGVGSTVINGVDDAGQLVGFYSSANGNTNGMLATP